MPTGIPGPVQWPRKSGRRDTQPHSCGEFFWRAERHQRWKNRQKHFLGMQCSLSLLFKAKNLLSTGLTHVYRLARSTNSTSCPALWPALCCETIETSILEMYLTYPNARKPKRKNDLGDMWGADIVPKSVFFLVLFLFLWFSGIWRGEVHLQNWALNDLLGNEMDTKCLIRNFHTCPKTQRSQRSFLDNYPKRDLKKSRNMIYHSWFISYQKKLLPNNQWISQQIINLGMLRHLTLAAPPGFTVDAATSAWSPPRLTSAISSIWWYMGMNMGITLW